MKVTTNVFTMTSLALLTLACTAQNAMAYGGLGTEVDDACASLGYPIAPEHLPRIADNCDACHDNNADGPGAGRDAYLNWKYAGGNLDFFCPPPADAPDINLDPNQISFGIVEVGSRVTHTTAVQNTGTQTLDVSAITPCTKTSAEYSLSPSSFSVSPGASQTLSITYSPVDENTDTGCMEVVSNDPDENPAVLGLSGTGYVFQSYMLDFDIERFRVSGRASLKKSDAVKAVLAVNNTGTSYGSATATLTGTQNGSSVYDKTIAISVGAGQTARFRFPEFVPQASGDILWTVTVADEDPDVDMVSAITRVVR
jgi:hypothetical protein